MSGWDPRVSGMGITHGGNLFAIAREHGWDWREVLDASASINPLGPSASVGPAICAALDRIAHYPEPDALLLIQSLAQTWNITEDQVLAGNGATELISFLARVMPETKQATLALPVFSEFHRLFRNARTADLQRPETWPQRGLLVLTRPANPTAWTLPLDFLQQRLAASNDPILIDESFLDFSEHASAATLLHRHPQLIILRSLTKLYALPGLRIGALLATAERISLWKQQREPWQVNAFAEAAALAALADLKHAALSREFIVAERDWLQKQIRILPAATPHESDANFLYVPLGYRAQLLCDHLLEHKILIRNCSNWPGLAGESVRIAVRRRHENERLLAAWRECQ